MKHHPHSHQPSPTQTNPQAPADPPVTVWEDCYDLQWSGHITIESFAHPAKMARGLLERIIDHGFEQGWWRKGDLIADPFGGVSTTAIIGTYRGLRVVTVELEPKFVQFGKDNAALHSSRWDRLGLPLPVILQGDSRQFDKLIAGAAGVVASPPFTQGYSSGGGINVKGYGPDGKDKVGSRTYQGTGGERSPGNIETLPCGSVAACVSSPPYADSPIQGGGANAYEAKKHFDATGQYPKGRLNTKHTGEGYGRTEGQISQLPSGEVSAVLSSPPWEDNCEGSRKAHKMGGPDKILAGNRGHGASDEARLAQAARDEQKVYGDSPGQIGRLKGGSVDGVLSSPPYNKPFSQDHPGTRGGKRANGTAPSSVPGAFVTYGQSDGQIEGVKPETYWLACKQVYAAVFRTIKPNGILVLVTKDFVRQGKRVPLSDDTVTLCESIGFVLIERIRAMLVSQTTHGDLFNGSDVKTKSRKSFFRRLAEGKGSPRIDWEDVLVFSRPPQPDNPRP